LICSIVSCVPKNAFNLDDYNQIKSDDLEKTKLFTGVLSKRTSNGEFSTLHLCINAMKKILPLNDLSNKDVEIVAFVTQSPNHSVPGNSYSVHKEMSLSKTCILIDLNIGCTGWIQGVFIVKSIMQQHNLKYGILLNGDTDVLTDINDNSTYPIIGDAGVASLIVNNKDQDVNEVFNFSYNGNYSDAIIEKKDTNNSRLLKVKMNSSLIAKYLLTEVIPFSKEFLRKNNANPDFFIPHQANKYFVDTLSKKLDIPKEKTLISYPHYGNTSSASIPLTICANNQVEKNKLFYCLAFGVGMSTAQMLFYPNKDMKTKLIEI